MNNDAQEQDCAVCLQKCHHPTQLPCGHVFCFLCVKGVAIQNRKCAMCRAEIPPDYLDHPILLEKLSPEQSCRQNSNEEYQWYYEGRNGWWKYDERSNSELETAFNAEETECNLLLAGALYCVDFNNMVQVRRSNPTRRRRVKRDVPTLPAKGIAGIKIFDTVDIEQSKSESDDSSNEVTSNQSHEVLEVNDTEVLTQNENMDAVAPQHRVLDDVVHRFSVINLREPDLPSDFSPTREDT